jgi:uncharacterized protein YjbI with pentapeptide repeats
VSDAPARAAAAASVAAWIEKLQRAIETASAEARGAFFYYAGFGLYFTLTVAGTTHEDLLRGSTVTMPGLGIGMPIEGFFLFVPMLFVVFHVYALLQLVILARRIGLLKRVLANAPASVAAGQEVLLSPFAVSQRLFGEPPGLVPRAVLRVSIWFTLVLIPLAVLIATQVRFLPYHSESVTWAHRLYIAIDILLLLLLWPTIVDPRGRSAVERLGALTRRGRRPGLLARARALGEIGRRRLLRPRRVGAARAEPGRAAVRILGAGLRVGVVGLALLFTFVVATIPGEGIERALLGDGQADGRAACSSVWRVGSWLRTVRLPDHRDVLCVTYALFEAPDTPLGLRRNLVARDVSLVVSEPTDELIRDLGAKQAWQRKGKGADLQGRDLRFADLSGSDLRRADLRGANLNGSVLQQTKLTASVAGDIPRSEVGACAHELAGDYCLTGLVGADLTGADLRYLEGWKADLREANLTAAALHEAALGQGRLDGALLVWAHLDGADMRGAVLTGAVLREAVAPEARLDGADLRYAFLRQADLAGAALTDARLDDADIGGTELVGASDPPADQDYQTTLTFDLFRRACADETGSAHGVVARIWHELDYSTSHDQPGYASIAGLRYLLARLILSPTTCAGAAAIHDQDVCRLHDFLKRWKTVRHAERRRFDPQLERSWSDLRPLVFAGSQQPVPGAATTGADRKGATDIWSELDAQLGAGRSCPNP